MKHVTFVALVLLVACGGAPAVDPTANGAPEGGARATAIFAGGCFWCMEPPFEKLDGVVSVVSGYTGGATASPTYEAVSSGSTGHYESVEVTYDPAKVSYDKLLQTFWRNVDALDDSGQFCDRGEQYRAAIFVKDDSERRLAEQSKAAIEAKLHTKVATTIIAAGPFFRAEEFHQDYYRKNPVRYKFYRYNCGRDARLEKLWAGKTGIQNSEVRSQN